MKVGYIRVSTIEQNEARQEVLMEQLGVDRVYMDKMSGKNKDRPQLQEMMQYVREGDIVIVESISRFARNTKDLLSLIEELERKKVTFVSQKENIDTNTRSLQNCTSSGKQGRHSRNISVRSLGFPTVLSSGGWRSMRGNMA